MLNKIISGGQIGADIAGVRAAKALGIETGGWMTADWKTKEGAHPEYKLEYGMRAIDTTSYAERTRLNVRDSDGTIRFATNWSSRGELCTLREIVRFNRPYFDVDPSTDKGIEKILDAVDWVRTNEIQVLNVAGNANQELESFVEAFIDDLISRTRSS